MLGDIKYSGQRVAAPIIVSRPLRLDPKVPLQQEWNRVVQVYSYVDPRDRFDKKRLHLPPLGPEGVKHGPVHSQAALYSIMDNN